MCGICGIINFDNQAVQDLKIRKMMHDMKHRGPDDEGVFIEGSLGLGFVRLSIIDLSAAGHQPMISKDNRFVVVFNGEIFNYLELRDELKEKGHKFYTNTDTEVVLTSYFEWGEDCQHKFNGMWAFVIYDRQQKSIFASRDRYGIKPFYYYINQDFIAFASEIPPLLTLLRHKPTPNYQSIFDYLVFNRTDQTENTFFSEIKKLQHGHSILFSTDIDTGGPPPSGGQGGVGIPIKQWYNLRTEISKQNNKPFTPEDFRNLFSDAINLRLRSDVPVGVCLSGGLDSSSIVSLLLKDYNKKDLKTFSAVYNPGQYGDESEFINLYRSDLENMFFITPDGQTLYNDLLKFVKAHAEPIPATGPYAQFKVMQLAQNNVVVTLDGQGADEMLAGYHYFFGFYFKDLLKSLKIITLSKEITFYLSKHRSFFGIKTFAYFLLPKKLRAKTRVSEKGYLNPDFVSKFKKTDSVSGNLYGANSLNEALIDHFEFKLEHLLKWEDRNSMWFSIEARVPFLDHRLVEKTLSLPGNQVIKKGMTKHLLRESMRGILPERIRLRKDKNGFDTPQDEWFRSDKFINLVTSILNSDSFKNRKIINQKTANELYFKHLKKEINISKEIWKWIHLELWFREFID